MLTHRIGLVTVMLLFGLLLAVPLMFQVASEDHVTTPNDATVLRLIVITPHNEQIRHEFARAFNIHRQAHGLASVVFDWRISGGTGDLRRQVLAEFTAAAQEGHEDRGIGKDLFFGGGDYEHNLLARGVTVERNGTSVRIPVTVSIALPEGLLEAVYPSPDIGGTPLYHQDLRWVGVAVSSFGIVYNRDVVKMLNLPHEPETWSDLTDPRYFHWVALADPAHSGSIAATYNAILRRLGWERGWALLRRVFANARYFSSSSSKAPVDVSAGEAAAGMCIDFYGRFQAGAIGGGRVGYVDPRFMTAITPDPVSILRGAPHKKLAGEFVIWLLSPSAQQLWQKRRGTPGGPEKFELRRMPVRRDVYTKRLMTDWTDAENPFNLARPFADGMPDFYRAIAPVAHAMAIDVHDELVEAWRALRHATDPPRREAILEAFDAMPLDLTPDWPDEQMRHRWPEILADTDHPRRAEVAKIIQGFTDRMNQRFKNSDALLADRLRWTKFFRRQYRRVVELAGEE